MAHEYTASGTQGPQRPLLCRHPVTGTVAWPATYRRGDRVKASVYCCRRKECIRDAASWVEERTGHRGEYRPAGGSEKGGR